jgi:hypothetical protein
MDTRRPAASTRRLKDLTAQEARELLERSEAKLAARAAVQDIQESIEHIARVARVGLLGRGDPKRLANAFRRISKKAYKARVALGEVGPLLDRVLALEEENKRPPDCKVVACPACLGIRTRVVRNPVLRALRCWKCGGSGKIVVPLRSRRPEMLQTPPECSLSLEDLQTVARGLSSAQKSFLSQLRAWRAHLEFGISTKRLRSKCVKSPSNNASFCRMISRLETKHLVLRGNCRRIRGRKVRLRLRLDEPQVKRTTHILLTPLGHAVSGLHPRDS